MCSVIGAVLKEPSLKDFEILRRVFLESKVRGMHATGISYIKHGKTITIKRPVPANEFPFHFPDYVNEDGNLYLVGHCRYSTSDLEYNQPIANDSISVVHNGVVTQELPEHWKELYGYDCETKNDTELLLHTIQENVSPLRRWKDSSLAVCVLQASEVSKRLKVFRNGKRPIYLTAMTNGVIITSTEDIPRRAGIKMPAVEVPLNTYLTFDENMTMNVESEKIEHSVDYQNYEDTSY